MPDRIGDLAAMDGYSPQEADFQFGVRATPWFGEFAQQHGEPNLNDPNYDYRAAWAAGARPNVRDPGDQQYHWPSQFKGPEHPNRFVNGVDTITGQPVSTGEEYAGLGGDPSHLANTIKNWWQSQPSWLSRAQAENQKTSEAFQRGGMGEIAKQLATDTNEAQDLYGAFGVGNIKGVRPPIAPGALAATSEYRPPFYSAVEQAVQGAKQNAAPGQQWAGFLRNQPGVKPEEVEALKLGKLFEQPGSVPKEAVLGEIAANRVNVGEVVKGGPDYGRILALEDERTALRQSLNEARTQISGAPDREAAVGRARELGDREMALGDEIRAAYGGPTKFSQYTLPGGENYREMLLTLPKKPVEVGPAPELLTELPKGPDWDNSYRVIRYRGDGPEREWGVIPPGQSHARAMAGQHPTEAEAVRQALNHINAQNAQQYNQALHDANKSGQFASSHFDEPNVLAHVRYNDRVIDGKKTLFVEEVQSDWHQKGKREGYRLSSEQTTPMDAEYRRLVHKNADARDAGQEPLAADVARAQELENALIKADKSNVPDAPFKTTWPELAMKRIIREAAEKGYDKVAWTPGSVQAARYPEQLRQHVDNISWSSSGLGGAPRPDGSRSIQAMPRNSNTPLSFIVSKDGVITDAVDSRARGQHVEDLFGKDMARQIMEKPSGDIASKDFVIGAKGMQGFYDEILPATVNRLVKKHGGRVTQGELRTAEENPLVFKLKDNGYDPETVDVQQILADNHGRLPRWLNDAELNAINMGEHLDIAGIKGDKVHTLDITPSLRAAAMKGFPLFSAGGVAATGAIGELARQDEYQ